MYCFVCGKFAGVDAILNVALFLPFGVALALLGFQLRGVAAISFLTTFAIESLQVAIVPGRNASIADLATNTVGGILGFALSGAASSLVCPSKTLALRLFALWSFSWLVVQLAVALAFIPAATDSPYHGQITRRTPTSGHFIGVVREARIAKVPFVNSAFATQAIRNAMDEQRALHLSASVVRASCSPGRADILRVVDEKQRDIAVLQQRGDGVAFGIRTGADVMRLRPIRGYLGSVFYSRGRCAERDSTWIDAAYVPQQLIVRARGTGALVAQPTLRDGWRLVAPVQTYFHAHRAHAVLGLAWTMSLFLPGAFWIWFASFSGDSGTDIRLKLEALCLIAVIGLSLLPRMIGSVASDPAASVALAASAGLGWWLSNLSKGRGTRSQVMRKV